MSQTKDEVVTEGWQADKMQGQRIYHYIGDGTFSLCGRLGFYTGELMPDNPEKRGREDCKACIKKLDARSAKEKLMVTKQNQVDEVVPLLPCRFCKTADGEFLSIEDDFVICENCGAQATLGMWNSPALEAEKDSVDEEKNPSGSRSESPSPALDRDWLRDRRTATISVQEVANRLHAEIYTGGEEHLAIHSCPCNVLAAYYLGLSDKPKMYWPDDEGGDTGGIDTEPCCTLCGETVHELQMSSETVEEWIQERLDQQP